MFDLQSIHMLSHTPNFMFLYMSDIFFSNSILMPMNYFFGVGIIRFDYIVMYVYKFMIIVNWFTIIKHFILEYMNLI